MPRFANRRIASPIFIVGLLLIALGSAFLLGSPPGVSLAVVYVSFLLIALGIVCAIAALKINRRSLYLFFAALFLQAGMFLFLNAIGIIPLGFSRIWPLLSVFVGVALLPAGWHRYGAIKPSYVVFASAFIALGTFLMVFALDIVGFSLRQFILDWWALMVVLAGLVLTLAALSSKHVSGLRKTRGGKPRKKAAPPDQARKQD